ncbi:hypothetical protein [Micromonospora cathayae]|uniref:Uncharacterized protein n=1 Tax=Micromonospora cathayae TaxID=3028804 RepID=A0ABY7ZSD5_9ACTN|nr:hypothetical protein [Micromonospora sp. HUAS 3]WDZ85092.1 hypothetical protein PVK37_01060 [Micromonospora sp. HUAS 3]
MIIEARFNGPPGSGNGGWSAGVFAAAAEIAAARSGAAATGAVRAGDAETGDARSGDAATGAGGTGEVRAGDVDGGAAGGAVEVTLRRPPPLAVPLAAVPSAAVPGRYEIHGPDATVIAQVDRVTEFTPVVPGVDLPAATAAAGRYPGFTDHPFPGCYVCGPDRPDGLRIFPGRLPDGRTAAPFRVPDEVVPATVWAALDCPGGWAVIAPGRPYVLGRIAVTVAALPRPGEVCVVTGAASGGEGRKALVHSSLYGPDGTLLAHARATWIALPPE